LLFITCSSATTYILKRHTSTALFFAVGSLVATAAVVMHFLDPSWGMMMLRTVTFKVGDGRCRKKVHLTEYVHGELVSSDF
jgi:hypothetical protein